jgi:hypothetical protein
VAQSFYPAEDLAHVAKERPSTVAVHASRITGWPANGIAWGGETRVVDGGDRM